ncbi:MAG: Dabb family protein [Verrucomicrobiales bacterium]|nr:Dabb family protein [Verrucomicrobiales bacterium]
MKSLISGILALIIMNGIQTVAAEEDHTGPFRHVVCFKFKDGTSEAEVAEIEQAFAALKDKIDTIIDFEWGPSENIEPLNDGFTHCFLVSFKDKAGLEVYLPHPDHKKFVDLLKPKLDKVFVFDYNAR